MTEHTPTPWKLHLGQDYFQIMEEDDDLIIPPVACYFETDRANAAFIVECCNNYESMKAQRDDLADLLSKALPFVEDAMTDQGYKAGAVEKYTESIRAALAKVKG